MASFGGARPKQYRDLDVGRVVKGVRENLICPICLDLFEDAKSLPCGHAVCEECIGQWVARKGGALTCPTCKKRNSLPTDGVVGLATNFALNNLVTELRRLDQASVMNEVSSYKEQLSSTLGAASTESRSEKQLLHVVTPQHRLSGVPVAETSFLEKINCKNSDDAKGSVITMRVQLCDFEGTNVRGRSNDKVEAMVLSPSNEKEKISVSFMKSDGDYSLSFTPNKVGFHLVEAYLNKIPVRGSPLKVLVHPSATLDTIIITPMHNPLDVVVYGGFVYATEDSGHACFRTDWKHGSTTSEEVLPCWKGNWRYPCGDRFDDTVDSYGIDASNNKFYVTVPRKRSVYVFDLESGEFKNSFGKRVLDHPTGIAVSKEGMIYVADSDMNTVEVFRPNFSHTAYMPAGGNVDHCCLALLALNPAEDRLIAADKGTNCFKIFDTVNRKMMTLIKTRVEHAPAKPFGVAVDGDGNMFVSVTFDPSRQKNPRGHARRKGKRFTGTIITYNSEGYFLGNFGDNLKDPNGLCIVGDELVVVDEGVKADFRLQVYKL